MFTKYCLQLSCLKNSATFTDSSAKLVFYFCFCKSLAHIGELLHLFGKKLLQQSLKPLR